VTSKNGKWNKLVAFTGANSWRRNHWESWKTSKMEIQL
jgi:hypothetical protein